MLKILGARLVLTEGAEGHEGRHRQGRGARQADPEQRHPPAVLQPVESRRSTARPRPRKSGATPTARSTSSCRASARAAPSPASARSSSRASPRCKIVAVEPAASPVLSGGQPGPHKLQGLGAGFIPAMLNTKIYDEVIRVKEADSAPISKQVNSWTASRSASPRARRSGPRCSWPSVPKTRASRSSSSFPRAASATCPPGSSPTSASESDSIEDLIAK